jgi:hypothetical protein
MTAEDMQNGTTHDDWAINEIICHLKDTEREIHREQLQLMLAREDAFIPRPESSVWANERDYLHVNGWTALDEFTSTRAENLKLLVSVGQAVWTRNARHAIFGPTNFLEVCGFMADHDRMHIQQTYAALKRIKSERVLSNDRVL